MKFFLPFAKDDKMARETIEKIRTNVATFVNQQITDRAIYKIEFYHNGKTYSATVGEEFAPLRESVVAILEAENLYLICTPSRGVLHQGPYLVGLQTAFRIVDFE